MKLNIPQLKQDRRELEVRIREVKTQLRSTWTKPMANEQYELIGLKRKATELCILRAWHRGRHHLPDAEYCQKIAEELAPRYELEEEAAA
jgi:hypothetical protein